MTIIDNRTGKSVEIPIKHNTINANGLARIGLRFIPPPLPSPLFHQLIFGVLICHRSYDPGFLNTSSATSRITYIDGDKGILRYIFYFFSYVLVIV